MIVDTNIHLGRWPFRGSPWSTTAAIVAKLSSANVGEAWAGSCEAPFDKDIAGVNERLVRECREARNVMLRPFGTVNPRFPDWRDDVRRCHESHGMKGIRLYPGYHAYKLDDALALELFDLAAARKLLVQIVVQMEDIRTQHPLMQVAPVDLTPLAAIIPKRPKLKLQVLNGPNTIPDPLLVPLARSKQVTFDIAMVEGLGGVARFVEKAGADAVLFGSHLPLFSLESAILKIREGGFSEADAWALESGNARRLIG